MKILSFSYCFPNEMNNNWGIFVYNRLKALSKLHDLRVCSPVPFFPLFSSGKDIINYEKHDYKGLDVYRPEFFYFPFILKNYDSYFYSSGIRKWFYNLLEDWKPDILDAHFVWPDGAGVYVLAQEAGIPYVITLRGKIYECIKKPQQKKLCQKALQGADAVISVSGLMAEEALKLGVKKEKIKIIPNGIDPNSFYIKDKSECRKTLNLPLEKKIIVSVAHLGHRKGHFEVIKAMAHLSENVILILVGAEAQGGKKEDLVKAARESGLGERLIITGPRPYEEIPFYFGAADVSVLASYREGCPNSVLESLACGVPVVATEVGAVPDILPVPEAGRIVPRQTVKPLADALNELLGKNFQKEDIVRAAGVRTWDEVGEEVSSVFEQIYSGNT
jgi:glycosyltransferase involved in cell wall biosynthesis